jgi:phage tail-like protein
MDADAVARDVLEFLNGVREPNRIRDTIQADPNFGQPLPHAINLSTARRILARRKELPRGRFASLGQIAGVKGVGPTTLHHILYTFWLRRSEVRVPAWQVSIDGLMKGLFLDVEGLEAATEIIEAADGGQLLVRKRPGRTACLNLVLRRELTDNRELWDWHQALAKGVAPRREGTITLLKGAGRERVRFRFSGAWPCRWGITSLSGKGKDLVVEEIELAVERLERV